jgi:hypothetical protein
MTLTPLQLTLPGGASTLTVPGGSTTGETVAEAATLNLAGRELSVSTGRTLSVALLLGALLTALALGLLARMSATANEAEAIRRRYAQMLVEVQPMPAPSGQPVIDVVDFEMLAKLAQRYELLVLHWTRGTVETFLVQDQATTYRYRTAADPRLLAPDAAVESA